MTVKAFRVEKLTDFIQLADQVSSPKLVDTQNGCAFFYARKRFDYTIQDREDVDKLLKRGFIQGVETESFDSW